MRRSSSYISIAKRYKKTLYISGLLASALLIFGFDGGVREEISLFASALKAPFSQKLGNEAHLQQLKLENTLLANEIANLKCQLQEKNRLLHISHESASFLYKPQSEIAVGRVLIKDLKPSSFTFWVDVGTKTCSFIGKGSPVCYGPYALGIIDYVGKKSSRVRLITDPKLQPSITALRGSASRSWMTDILDAFKEDEKLQKRSAQLALKLIRSELQSGMPSYELSTGYLTGMHEHMGERLLKGEGFIKEHELKRGDRLITSGLDGLFPKGLLIGKIEQISRGGPSDLSYGAWIKPIYTKKRPPFVYILPPIEAFLDD